MCNIEFWKIYNIFYTSKQCFRAPQTFSDSVKVSFFGKKISSIDHWVHFLSFSYICFYAAFCSVQVGSSKNDAVEEQEQKWCQSM